MTHPELTITTTDEGSQILWEATETHRTMVGKVCGPGKAARLVACWNACREMDDPVAEIAELSQRNVDQRDSLTRLREYIDQREKEHALLREGNQSLLQKLSEKDDPYFKRQAIVVGHGISTSSMLDASDHRPDSSPSLTEHATRLRHFLRAAYSLILSGDDANKEILLERIESAMVNCSLILSSAK